LRLDPLVVILSSLASIFRSRLTAAAMVWINRLSGILIAGFGLFAMLSLLKM
jgi:threonine/homoserine/homoserine lactone efflux protein